MYHILTTLIFSGNTGAVDRTLKNMEDLHFV